MTVTKLVEFSKVNRVMHVSRIDKLKLNGLRVYRFIAPDCISKSVDDARELQRVTLYYQNQ